MAPKPPHSANPTPTGQGRVWALVYNPTAGKYNPATLKAIQAELEAQAITVRLLPTQYAGHATLLARQTQDVETLAVYGGDGSLNEAANGLAGTPVKLAFLPGGTANVAAYEWGLPQDPVKAARLLAKGQAMETAPGLIKAVWGQGEKDNPAKNGSAAGERLFLLMAGFGFDARAVYGVKPGWKKRLGKGAYVASGLGAFLGPLPKLKLESKTLGGSPITRQGRWVVAARAAHYGGPFVVHPQAGSFQPHLGVTSVVRSAMAPFLALNLALKLRRAVPGAHFDLATGFTLRSVHPFEAQLDGDFFAQGREFTVAISPKKVWLWIPKNPS